MARLAWRIVKRRDSVCARICSARKRRDGAGLYREGERGGVGYGATAALRGNREIPCSGARRCTENEGGVSAGCDVEWTCWIRNHAAGNASQCYLDCAGEIVLAGNRNGDRSAGSALRDGQGVRRERDCKVGGRCWRRLDNCGRATSASTSSADEQQRKEDGAIGGFWKGLQGNATRNSH